MRCHVDGPRKHYGKKPDTKGHTLCESIYLRSREQADPDSKQTGGCQGLEGGGMQSHCLMGEQSQFSR